MHRGPVFARNIFAIGIIAVFPLWLSGCYSASNVVHVTTPRPSPTPVPQLFVANCESGGSVSVFNQPLSAASPLFAQVATGPGTSISGVAVDANGNLYAMDWSTRKIFEIAPPYSGSLTTAILYEGDLQAGNIVFDSSGNLVVAGGSTVDIYAAPFSQTESFSTLSSPAFTKSPSSGAVGLAFDPSGDLFVSSFNDIVTIFPHPYQSSAATSMTISNAFGLEGETFDKSGNLWIADAVTNEILEVTPPFSGTKMGTVVHSGFGAGSGVTGVAFDADDNLLVSVRVDSAVLSYAPPYTGPASFQLPTGSGSKPCALAFGSRA